MENNFELGSFENPVKCKDIAGEHKYFDAQCGPDGIRIEYSRRGSKMGTGKHVLDLYEVRYHGLEEPILVYMDMYAKPPYDKKPVKGLYLINSFLKPKYWQKPDYFSSVVSRVYPDNRPAVSGGFINLYTKAALLLALGEYIYSKNDQFGCPLPDWDIQGILSTAERMVHQAEGLSENNPLIVNSIKTALDFIKTFHHNPELPNNPEKSEILKISASHFMMDYEIEIYFKLKEE